MTSINAFRGNVFSELSKTSRADRADQAAWPYGLALRGHLWRQQGCNAYVHMYVKQQPSNTRKTLQFFDALWTRVVAHQYVNLLIQDHTHISNVVGTPVCR